jgi:hypothetical protein
MPLKVPDSFDNTENPYAESYDTKEGTYFCIFNKETGKEIVRPFQCKDFFQDIGYVQNTKNGDLKIYAFSWPKQKDISKIYLAVRHHYLATEEYFDNIKHFFSLKGHLSRITVEKSKCGKYFCIPLRQMISKKPYITSLYSSFLRMSYFSNKEAETLNQQLDLWKENVDKINFLSTDKNLLYLYFDSLLDFVIKAKPILAPTWHQLRKLGTLNAPTKKKSKKELLKLLLNKKYDKNSNNRQSIHHNSGIQTFLKTNKIALENLKND